MRAAVIGSEPMVRKRLPIATPRVGGTLLLALIIVSAPLWMANNYAYDVAIQVALGLPVEGQPRAAIAPTQIVAHQGQCLPPPRTDGMLRWLRKRHHRRLTDHRHPIRGRTAQRDVCLLRAYCQANDGCPRSALLGFHRVG